VRKPSPSNPGRIDFNSKKRRNKSHRSPFRIVSGKHGKQAGF